MPVYYLKHPLHGAHVVYTADEVKFHEERGWSVQDETKPEPAPVAAAVIESAKRKPGRPRKER